MTSTATPRRRRSTKASSTPATPAAPIVLGHEIEAHVVRLSQVPPGPLRETAARALSDGLFVWLARQDGRPLLLVTNNGSGVTAWLS